jgi:hypothetical protein
MRSKLIEAQREMTSIEFATGGYRFIRVVFRYSAGATRFPAFALSA